MYSEYYENTQQIIEIHKDFYFKNKQVTSNK